MYYLFEKKVNIWIKSIVFLFKEKPTQNNQTLYAICIKFSGVYIIIKFQILNDA